MNASMSRCVYKIAAIAAGMLLALLFVVRMSPSQSILAPLDAREPISYFIAEGKPNTGYQPSDRELALWALQAWQRTAKTLQFRAGPQSAALIRVYWAEPDGHEYGEMVPLNVGSRRGAAVYIRPDVNSLGPGLARRAREDALLRETVVYLTCLHELGHALGLSHTQDFADIMYYFGYGGDVLEFFGRYRAQIHSRNDITAISGLSHADESRVTALYPARHDQAPGK